MKVNVALVAGLVLLIAQVHCKGGVMMSTHKPTPTVRRMSTHPTTQPTKPPTCPKNGKDFQVQIKVMGQGDYRYEMTQVSSQEFQDVREKIYDCALQTYADYDYYQDLILISIENTTGGFVPNFAIRFTKEGDGHLNRLSQAINSGKFCDLEVAPKFVMCDELDQTLLYPYGAAEQQPAAPCVMPTCDQTLYVPAPPAPVAPPPPPPPPAPPVQGACAPGCPATCAPSCIPACCFRHNDWFNFKRQKMLKVLPNPHAVPARRQPYLIANQG